MLQWEYTMVYVEREQPSVEELMNELGQDGWELVSVLHERDAMAVDEEPGGPAAKRAPHSFLFFKKPKEFF